MKKTRLKIDYDYDFFLLGIVSAAKEYKLAWKLNNALNIKLVKQEDIVIPQMGGRDLYISNLLYETENSRIRLISNRSMADDSEEKSNLLPELQNFTHFFVLQDESESFDQTEIVDIIKKLDATDYVVSIAPEKLKNKDNLIF